MGGRRTVGSGQNSIAAGLRSAAVSVGSPGGGDGSSQRRQRPLGFKEMQRGVRLLPRSLLPRTQPGAVRQGRVCRLSSDVLVPLLPPRTAPL